MRFRGVNHVEINVVDYENSIKFYDRMFGWLGYSSFETLGIGNYTSTYYTAFPHSYIGVQPARTQGLLRCEEMAPGINHVALQAKNRKEIDRFYEEFLLGEGVRVLDPPGECPLYTPDYYAVFFVDPTGIRWELVHFSFIPNPRALFRWLKLMGKERKKHPEWKRHPFLESWRRLPRRAPAHRRGKRK